MSNKVFGDQSNTGFNTELFLEARATFDDLLSYFKTRDYSFKIGIEGDENGIKYNITLIDPAGFTTTYQDSDVLTTIFLVNSMDDFLKKKSEREKSKNWLNDISRKQMAGRRAELKEIMNELMDELINERKAKKAQTT